MRRSTLIQDRVEPPTDPPDHLPLLKLLHRTLRIITIATLLLTFVHELPAPARERKAHLIEAQVRHFAKAARRELERCAD